MLDNKNFWNRWSKYYDSAMTAYNKTDGGIDSVSDCLLEGMPLNSEVFGERERNLEANRLK